jgi:uncharacterized DUF497 family protein
VKARTNQRKHLVSFMDAMTVFEDHLTLFEQDGIGEAGALRWQAVGLAGSVVVLLVAFTVREEEGESEIIRLISARRATREERNRYEQVRAQDSR